jgi:hypothetical protein
VNVPIAVAEPAGIAARAIAVSDEHHGVVVTATAVARSREVTAIEIEGDIVDEPGVETTSRVRYLQGIGASNQRGLANELLMLRDDQGHQHLERHFRGQPGARQRQVASFPGLPDEVRSGTIEIPFVVVQQRTEEIPTAPVPGETEMRFLGCEFTVVTSRTGADNGRPIREGRPDYDGPRVRVEIRPKDADAPKQLLQFSMPRVEGAPDVGMWGSQIAGKAPVVEVPDPSGEATAVKLRGPVLKLLGPWRLELPLD